MLTLQKKNERLNGLFNKAQKEINTFYCYESVEVFKTLKRNVEGRL